MMPKPLGCLLPLRYRAAIEVEKMKRLGLIDFR